jgi:hypothetical protein
MKITPLGEVIIHMKEEIENLRDGRWHSKVDTACNERVARNMEQWVRVLDMIDRNLGEE